MRRRAFEQPCSNRFRRIAQELVTELRRQIDPDAGLDRELGSDSACARTIANPPAETRAPGLLTTRRLTPG